MNRILKAIRENKIQELKLKVNRLHQELDNLDEEIAESFTPSYARNKYQRILNRVHALDKQIKDLEADKPET